MDLSELLADFGVKAGMGPLALDSNGACRLVFDGRLEVDIAVVTEPGSPPGFILFSTVGPVAPSASPDLLRHFLSANLFARGANDAVVALNTDRDEAVILCRHTCESMDGPVFEAALMDFLDQTESWSDYIARDGTEPEPETEPSPSADSFPAGGFVRV